MQRDDQTTRRARGGGDARREGAGWALTVAAHPALKRIGERAMLEGLTRPGGVGLSRNGPDFAPPTQVWAEPLGDPFLSRRPIVLQALGDRIVIERAESPMEVRIAGEPLGEVAELPVTMCDEGVDLELARRHCLLLHRAPEAGSSPPPSFGLVGASDALDRTRRAVARVADLDVTVILRGETGTGKELVARAIHDHGGRADGPFVAVNLSAIPPSLAAAELFGAVKGAYTGADRDHKGLFQTADGGTLFLDEVGECPAEVQTMLLRALETSEISPVGRHDPRRVDVRLVAATDSDLERRVRDGGFKEPLLHRLSAYEVWLPPLRERREDIGRLVVHFATAMLAELGSPLPQATADDDPPWLPADLAGRLVRYRWPGNVRQLRNVVSQLVIDSREHGRLRLDERILRLLEEEDAPDGEEGTPATTPGGWRRPGSVAEEEMVSAMERCGWVVAEAARHLGVSRASLYELIRTSDQVRTADELGEDEVRNVIESSGGDVTAAAAELRVSSRALRRHMKRLAIEADGGR